MFIDQLGINLIYLISRYFHIVSAGLLVGGTLFYELIVPVAIDELKDAQKLSVFARARWAFRWTVVYSSAGLLLSGAVSSYRNWQAYNGTDAQVSDWTWYTAEPHPQHSPHWPVHVEGPGYWWLAHASGGVVAAAIALALVRGRTPPRYPLAWMRINLLVLLVVIFLASTARHVRLRMMEGLLPPPRSMAME